MEAVVFQGLSNKDLANRFGLTEMTISRIVNSPLFKIELEDMRRLRTQAAHDRLAQLQNKAIDALDETVGQQYNIASGTGESQVVFVTPQNRIASAKEILSRTGLNAPLTINVSTLDSKEHLAETLSDIRKQKAEIAAELGIALDYVPSSSPADSVIEVSNVSEGSFVDHHTDGQMALFPI